ncbi:ABC transporter permease subunit [Ruminococcaceae bacterium OttesenSCG-928-L11]|nr:ABC transporter permease subunit [Ruminococcaceae bacterium OttesenSCG-928-L11]
MTKPQAVSAVPQVGEKSFFTRLKANYRRHKSLYIICVPILLYYIIFKYLPMFGVVIAFQDFRPGLGFTGSPFVGLKYFVEFLTNPTASRTIRNTIVLNLYNLAFGFPAPIILALLLNEMRGSRYKKAIQTVSYLPHFISLVVVCGILKDFSASYGIFNDFTALFGREPEALLGNVDLYRGLYVGSGIWKNIGWGSILYLATLSGTDPNLYEAAVIDGAGRWKQLVHITIPTIVPITILQLIMRVGSMMSEGAEKTILLYSPLVYEKADIISSFVYRRGLQEANFSFGAAVGLFNSIINLCLLVGANWASKKATGESMW